ncbi:MAG: hypothetical protein AAGA93_08790 [Actinomycetota bacterium]
MADAEVERVLTRQEQIWAGLYGPPRATALVAEARRRLEADPGLDPGEVLQALDPDEEIDADEAGTFRPAVG